MSKNVNMAKTEKIDLKPLLNILHSSHLNQFLHDCVDDLTGKRIINFVNYSSRDLEWTLDDFNQAKNTIQNFYRQSVITNTFNLDPSFEETSKLAIKNCFEIRKSEIFQVLAKECVTQNGHTLVENFDWKLKWILGTSDLATIREPLLQMDLYCIKKQNEKTENNIINFEASLGQVDDLIKELTKASKDFE